MTDKTHVIDEDGEVIIILENANAPFAVWSDNEQDVEIPQELETKNDETAKNEYRIQVSAKHLMLASPVFKKTLSGGWKESFNFVNKGSVEIKVDSWDIGAFVIFMKIIHCRLNAIPRKLNLELLSKITALADYYGYLDIMSIFRDVWISQLRNNFPTSHCRDLLLWLWISWAFRVHDLFQKATLTAMAQSNGWITNLGLPIPEKIIDTMNDQRQSTIYNIVDSLHQKKENLLHSDCHPCNAALLGNLIMEMNSNGLLSPTPTAPFLGISL
ncbi:uncharacterized protein ASPGLDRAFT_162963 [Aspergillus glaucus CBS 516.65]|uniref:BTB domain-containing protein n=1 Tax=Aspergillus glaucus CBS 516.65 TaxID=1160497 RepID=A0A1L9VX98_ASPGL|nr:hypothetical protein ASPGLDRAFT_162963 [Aspergillus glaucus CBS 516.65]OJJ88525.1 hypothetical protein ASPGLDRAFT_162963 [Aspergillus glaucus CBS 516.65]